MNHMALFQGRHFEPRKEMEKALVGYDPYGLTASQKAFQELYGIWFGEYREKLSGVIL